MKTRAGGHNFSCAESAYSGVLTLRFTCTVGSSIYKMHLAIHPMLPSNWSITRATI